MSKQLYCLFFVGQSPYNSAHTCTCLSVDGDSLSLVMPIRNLRHLWMAKFLDHDPGQGSVGVGVGRRHLVLNMQLVVKRPQDSHYHIVTFSCKNVHVCTLSDK